MKARDLVEVGLLYVGISAVTLYASGFAGLFVRLWIDNFFTYYDFNTIWDAVATSTGRRWCRTGPSATRARSC